MAFTTGGSEVPSLYENKGYKKCMGEKGNCEIDTL